MKKIYICSVLLFLFSSLWAGDIPQPIAYTQVYDFLDELANDGVIEIRSVVKPYSREYIANKLAEAKTKEETLTRRQQKDLNFYLNDYALELNGLPQTKVDLARNENLTLALVQPAFHYKDELFKLRLTPILGAEFQYNSNDLLYNRRFGLEFQGTIAKNVTVFASLRDIAFRGGELLSQPGFLNTLQGNEYKEVESGGGADYSDSRGGIKFSNNWLSIGLMKEQLIWGDNYNGSNIISGRAPSFPMITLQLKPTKWFQLDYFHGWLVSNVIDDSYYYVDIDGQRAFRNANKFMAANMLTFTPVRKLNISFGNAIVYAERNVQAAYFIPIAFYKSLDHTLTKGIGAENQNSQMFFNVSSRNINHLHLYASVFVDEFSFKRLKKSNKEKNPISYKIGGRLSNWPLENVSLTGEYTHTYILNYTHSIPALTWASNSYSLGHYLQDNSQEVYLALNYKPIRGLDITLSYLNAKHGNVYDYERRVVENIISQDFMKDVVWTNETFAFKVLYEICNNVYAGMNIEYSNIQGHTPTSEPIDGEVRLDGQGYLDLFTPAFLQGKNTTLSALLTIGF